MIAYDIIKTSAAVIYRKRATIMRFPRASERTLAQQQRIDEFNAHNRELALAIIKNGRQYNRGFEEIGYRWGQMRVFRTRNGSVMMTRACSAFDDSMFLSRMLFSTNTPACDRDLEINRDLYELLERLHMSSVVTSMSLPSPERLDRTLDKMARDWYRPL